MPKRSSTVRGREFGEGLRAAIAEAGFTGRGVAEVLGWQEAKLSDLVNGKGGTDEFELALLLGALRTQPAERDHLQDLFPDVHVKGWWQQHGARLPIHPRTLVAHLSASKTLISWQTHVIPTALRTTDYQRAVIAASSAVPEIEIESRVLAGLGLQKVALRRGLESTFYVHEVALRLVVGGQAVHAEQVHHLLRMSVRPNVTLRILLSAVGAHAGMSGPFTYMAFPRYNPLVCLENENSILFVEEAAAVAGYKRVADALDEAALGVDESRELLHHLGLELSAEAMDTPSSESWMPDRC